MATCPRCKNVLERRLGETKTKFVKSLRRTIQFKEVKWYCPICKEETENCLEELIALGRLNR